jgi:hypothetical protein
MEGQAMRKFIVMLVHRNPDYPNGLQRVFVEERAQSICLALVNAWAKNWREGKSQSITAWEKPDEEKTKKSA